MKGSVRWFDAVKGYGFIGRDDGGPDVFVHISEVDRAGLDALQPDQRVSFELGHHRGRPCAVNLANARAAA